MLLPRDDLELQLREFGVDDIESLLKKKTSSTDKIVKPSDLTEAPRLVEMTADQCKKLCEKAGLQYRPGYEGRVIERVTTTERPDRYGDIVRAKGVDVSNYRKNPVVLFVHNHGDYPVGVSLKEWIDNGIKGWRSQDLYLGDEVDTTGRSDLTFRMVLSGAMKGGSIGFLPKEERHDHSPEERGKIGLGKFGVEYLSCEKLEHSACSIPANPEALSNCLKSIEVKRLKAAFALKDIDRMVAQKMLDEQLADVFASVLGVKRTILTPPAPVIPGEEKVNEEIVLKPYPNEHSCRLKEPGEFSEFRRGTREHNGKTYSVIYGKKKDSDQWGEQAYRYPKATWTESEAREHCTNHSGISFEPAAEKDAPAAQGQQINQAYNITINTDLSEVKKDLCEISQQIRTFNDILEKASKSFSDKSDQLLAATTRALTALEQRTRQSSLYDRRQVENVLSIGK